MMGYAIRKKGHTVLSATDVAVVAAGASAVTANYWAEAFAWLPAMAQGIIVTGTVIFVVVRAIREVNRFISDWRGDRRED